MRYIHVIFLALLVSPFKLYAQPIVVPASGSENYQPLHGTLPFGCYNGPETGNQPVFGEFKKGRFQVLEQKKLIRKRDAYKKKIAKAKTSTRNIKATKKQKDKLKSFKQALKLLKKGSKLCKNSTPVNPPTPTPTPKPTGPFSGDAYSIDRYHNDVLSLEECKHLLRKAAFGGDKKLLDICVTKGLDAVVEAILAVEAPVELRGEPERWPYSFERDNFYVLDGNGNRVPFHIHGVSASQHLAENTWLPLLAKANPLREWITYQLTDWFASNLEMVNCSNATADIFISCVYPYFKLYHNNALNFSSDEPLAGTFETLVQQQVWDTSMQWWLDNSVNCNKNGQNANENFGRELMELFTLGTLDLYGVPTYDNRSVIAAAQASSGYQTAWQGHETKFNQWSCPAYKNEKVLFPDSPWGPATTFKINNPDLSQHYPELVRGILYNHPHSSKYIAGGLFSRLIHQTLGANAETDRLLAQVSDKMMNVHKYHIGKYIKDLLVSEAMFSSESLRSAIATPTDTFIRLIRLLEIPVIERGLYTRMNWANCTANDPDPDCSNPLLREHNVQKKTVKRNDGTPSTDDIYAQLIPDVPMQLREALIASGDLPGHPPSVFGREAGTAGKWRGDKVHKGHDALTAQLLLLRINGLTRVLNTVDPYINTNKDMLYAYDPRKEQVYKFSEKLSVNGGAPIEIVKLLEETLDVPLSESERAVMIEYLGENFQSLPAALKETRLKGLVVLFYQHPLFLLS